MTVYVVFFVLLALFTFGYRGNSARASIIMSLLLWLLIGLRDISVGADTIDYVTNDFMQMRGMSYSSLLPILEEANEPLFFFITWLIAQITESYTVFLLFWAAFPVFAIYSTLKDELRDSLDFWIAILVFFLLGLYSFYVAGLRQTVTISIVLFAYRYVKEPIKFKTLGEKRFWKFFLCIFIGYFIHNSIAVFGLIYVFLPFLQRIKMKWWYIIPVLLLFFIGRYINIGQIRLISLFLFEERYSSYSVLYESSMTTSAFIMQLMLFLICFIVHRKQEKADRQNTLLLNLVLLGIVFQSMAGILAEMTRVSYYFSCFYLILIPRSLRMLSGNSYGFISTLFSILGLFFLFFLSSAHLPLYRFAQLF